MNLSSIVAGLSSGVGNNDRCSLQGRDMPDTAIFLGFGPRDSLSLWERVGVRGAYMPLTP